MHVQLIDHTQVSIHDTLLFKSGFHLKKYSICVYIHVCVYVGGWVGTCKHMCVFVCVCMHVQGVARNFRKNGQVIKMNERKKARKICVLEATPIN